MTNLPHDLAKIKGQWQAGLRTEAIRRLEEIARVRPKRADLQRLLLRWLDMEGRHDAAEDVLRRWMRDGDKIGAVEAMSLLGARAHHARDPEAQAEMLVFAARAKARREHILAQENLDLPSRLELLSLGQDDDGLLSIMQEEAKELPKLSIELLSRVVETFVSKGRATALLPVLEIATPGMLAHPVLRKPLARALHREGNSAGTLRLIEQWDHPEPVPIDLRLLEIELLAKQGQGAVAAKRLAQWAETTEKDSSEYLSRARVTLATNDSVYRDDPENRDILLAAAERLSTRSNALPAIIASCQLLNEMGEPERTLSICCAALERFPKSRVIIDAAYSAALRLTKDESTREHRARVHLLDSIDGELAATAGGDALTEAGGHTVVQAAFASALATPASGSGLLSLARMFAQIAAKDVKLSEGRRREAEVLKPYGAADWSAVADRAGRALIMARLLTVLALRIDPVNDEAADLIFRLHVTGAMVRTAASGERPTDASDALIAALCQARCASKERLPQDLAKSLWMAALSLDDPILWETLEADQNLLGCANLRLHRLEPLTRIAAQVCDKGQHETAARVYGPEFEAKVCLSFPIFDDKITRMNNVRVYGGTMVEMPDGVIARQSHAHHVLPIGDHIAFRGMHAVALHPAEEVHVHGPALVVPCGKSHFNNYFHFAAQTLPRIYHWAKLIDPDARVVVPHDLPNFAVDLLKIVGIHPDRLLQIRADKVAIIEDAIVMTPLTGDWQCEPDQLAAVRAALRPAKRSDTPPKFGKAWYQRLFGPRERREEPYKVDRGQRRIYLLRSHGTSQQRNRIVTNEDDLIALAKNFGFEMVDPGQMTVDEQRALFAEADAICGPTGAALTNMLYMPEDADVLCFSPHETCRTYFPGLTLGSRQRFHWILGTFEPEVRTSHRFPHLPYNVPAERLHNALKTLP